MKMSRIIPALSAAVITVCLAGTSFAQMSPPNTEPAPSTSAPPPAAAPESPPPTAKSAPSTAEPAKPSRRDQRRAAKQQKRADCRAEAQAKNLRGEERRTFMKQCRS
jgi:hypothetical protein